jgi:hypothetical protein
MTHCKNGLYFSYPHDISVPGYGFPEDGEETPAPASHTNGTRTPALAGAQPQATETRGAAAEPVPQALTPDVPGERAPSTQRLTHDLADDFSGHVQPLVAVPPYDATKYVLGKLCPRGHEWGTTGQSLLSIHGHTCKECKNEYKRRKRAEKHQRQLA